MRSINSKKIFISAGEASGDLLGASLATALLKKNPDLTLTGMGGQRMRDAGVSIQFDANKLSVIGLVEIIRHLPSILSTWRAIKKYFIAEKPDLVILIDFPDTHFRFLKTLKKLGIPVVYYVSPQIWAWRFSRIKQIKKYVDHMAVLFSFEEKIYRDAAIPVTFVGHPLGTIVKPTRSVDAAYDFFKLDRNRPIIALFPGSRRSELDNHLATLIDATKIIAQKNPNTQFVLVLANHFDMSILREKIPAEITIIQNNLYDLLQITHAAIAVSGTVTLEIALMQVPLCIIYRMKPLTFWIAKKIIHVDYIGLCNVVSEKLIAKEFIQDKATPENLANEINELLTNQSYYSSIKSELAKIRSKISLVNKNSSEVVADIALASGAANKPSKLL